MINKYTMSVRYPSSVDPRALAKAIDSYNLEKIATRRSFGWVAPGDRNLQSVSHLVTSLVICDGQLVAEIETLDTPRGRVLDSLLAAKNPFHLVTMGTVADGAVALESFDAEDARPPAEASAANYAKLKEIAEETGLDLKKMEAAADRLVSAGIEAGLNRKEMASVCAAIAANHMIATGVDRERAAMTMDAMYAYRLSVGLSEKVLVKE